MLYRIIIPFHLSTSTIDFLQDCGEKVTDDKDKAELLNEFFASVLTNETDINHSELPDCENVKFTVKDLILVPSDVRVKLTKLAGNKASGPDLISVNVLRNCPDFDVPLCLLFNQSLQTGMLPQDWRDANVTPLHKKGPRSKKQNYRPVSLTSQVVKILERLVQDVLLNLLQKNETITCHQHGFQAKCSCITQLLSCLNDWTESFDKHIQTDVIYMDFAKAFDSVPHKRLLLKLKRVGIRGKMLNWIEGFLSSRRQRVVLQNGVSSWVDVISGVPQGSILGPLLFLIYVNDIPGLCISTTKLFADDTKLYREIKSTDDCKILQEDLNSLSVWSETWLLKFNAGKCVVLKIKKKIKYKYSLNGVYLQEVANQRDLGVIISNDLSPRTHIIEIVKKANQRVGMIRRCFSNHTAKKVQTLYTTMVRSVLEYGAPTWSPYYNKDIDNLEKVQKRCLRLSKEEIVLPSLSRRRLESDLCEIYKYIHGFYRSGAEELFTKAERQLGGHSYKLFRPYAKTIPRTNFFSLRAVGKWNSLPQELVETPTLRSFRRNLSVLLTAEEGQISTN